MFCSVDLILVGELVPALKLAPGCEAETIHPQASAYGILQTSSVLFEDHEGLIG